MAVLLGDASLSEGEVRVVWYREGTPPKKSFLVVHSQAGLRVYWNVCRHLPIPLDAGSGNIQRSEGSSALVCATHGACYRPEDGRCFDGPCVGESLEAVAFEVREGKIFALVGEPNR